MKSKLFSPSIGVEVVIPPKSTFSSTDWNVLKLYSAPEVASPVPNDSKFSKLALPVIWVLSAVSIIGEEAWYSPYSVALAVPCKTSIPPKLFSVFSVKVLVVVVVVVWTKSVPDSNPVLAIPKSNWALVSKFVVAVFVFTSAL